MLWCSVLMIYLLLCVCKENCSVLCCFERVLIMLIGLIFVRGMVLIWSWLIKVFLYDVVFVCNLLYVVKIFFVYVKIFLFFGVKFWNLWLWVINWMLSLFFKLWRCEESVGCVILYDLVVLLKCCVLFNVIRNWSWWIFKD